MNSTEVPFLRIDRSVRVAIELLSRRAQACESLQGWDSHDTPGARRNEVWDHGRLAPLAQASGTQTFGPRLWQLDAFPRCVYRLPVDFLEQSVVANRPPRSRNSWVNAKSPARIDDARPLPLSWTVFQQRGGR